MRLRKHICLWLGLCSAAHAQWQVQAARTPSDLFSISALNSQVAWAGGAEGTVLRTIDGGSTWQHCPVPAGAGQLQFRAMQAFTSEMAIAMSSGKGDLSRLYKTTDGCKSWTLVLTNPDPEGVWQSMQFHWNPGRSPETGYFSAGVLLGRPVEGAFPIFTSKDYGETWRSLQEDEAYSPGPSANANMGEELLALSGAALTTATEDNTFAFVTGGAGGGRLLYPQAHHEEFNSVSTRYSFADVHLPTAATGGAGGFALGSHRTGAGGVDMMVVGGDALHPSEGFAVLIRRTGLKRFFAPTATASAHPPHGLRTAVAFDEASGVWIAVGPNGTDTSQDDGRTWVALTAAGAHEADQGWTALCLPFAVGAGGRIGRWRGGAPAGPAMETAKADALAVHGGDVTASVAAGAP